MHQNVMSSLEVTCFITTTLCSVSVTITFLPLIQCGVMVVFLNIVIACDARRRVNVQTWAKDSLT